MMRSILTSVEIRKAEQGSITHRECLPKEESHLSPRQYALTQAVEGFGESYQQQVTVSTTSIGKSSLLGYNVLQIGRTVYLSLHSGLMTTSDIRLVPGVATARHLGVKVTRAP
jgi:hypothetical protein